MELGLLSKIHSEHKEILTKAAERSGFTLKQISCDHDLSCLAFPALIMYPYDLEKFNKNAADYLRDNPGADLPFILCCGESSGVPSTLSGNLIPVARMDLDSLENSFALLDKLLQRNMLISRCNKMRIRNDQIIDIAKNVSSEVNLGSLLDYTLTVCREQYSADAGSVYVRERDQTGRFTDKLRFKISQNDTVTLPDETSEFLIDINHKTISGYVAATGRPLNIHDVYDIPEEAPYHFGKSFDDKFGYRMKSMLTVPLKNVEGVVVGVLQLMNKKECTGSLADESYVNRFVTPFQDEDIHSIEIIMSLAAVSIERAFLYEDIERLFEGFISSSMAAIDARDHATSGHSDRVMQYAMGFVDEMNSCRNGEFAAVYFSDLRRRRFRYAALLHDIGKIGVPEGILTKEAKLSHDTFQVIKERIKFIKWKIRREGGDFCVWDDEAELEKLLSFLERINYAGFVSDDELLQVRDMFLKEFVNHEGERECLIPERCRESLLVKKGNLVNTEREKVERHAAITYSILSQIPWIMDYMDVPFIAAHHHEKMDGSGYPDSLKGEDIPLESRMLAVLDIYDALVAQDRSYKPSVDYERALAVLNEEADAGRLDKSVVEFFIEKKIYAMFLD